LTAVNVRWDESPVPACSADLATYYVDGPISTTGTAVYVYAGGAYSLLSFGWIVQVGTNLVYETESGLITGTYYNCLTGEFTYAA
jgi:hypothetical protein